jgi:hypothetical protein
VIKQNPMQKVQRIFICSQKCQSQHILREKKYEATILGQYVLGGFQNTKKNSKKFPLPFFLNLEVKLAQSSCGQSPSPHFYPFHFIQSI